MPEIEAPADSIARIESQGFAIFAALLDTNAIDKLANALEHASLARTRAGVRHAMQDPAIAAFARNPRLMQIVRAVLGAEALPYRATLFDKSPDSNWLVVWHQDTALPLQRRIDGIAGWGPWSVKAGITYAHAPASALDRVLALRIHLDDSTSSNGPLRVIPGTHTLGVMTDAIVKSHVEQRAPVDCLIARGGVLAMRPLLIHASSKSRDDSPRRVLHIEYAASSTLEHGLVLAIA